MKQIHFDILYNYAIYVNQFVIFDKLNSYKCTTCVIKLRPKSELKIKSGVKICTANIN